MINRSILGSRRIVTRRKFSDDHELEELSSRPTIFQLFPFYLCNRSRVLEQWCDYSVRQRYHCNEFPDIGRSRHVACHAALQCQNYICTERHYIVHFTLYIVQWIAMCQLLHCATFNQSRCTALVHCLHNKDVTHSLTQWQGKREWQRQRELQRNFSLCSSVQNYRVWYRDRYLFVHQPCNQPVLLPPPTKPRGGGASANIEICQISANISTLVPTKNTTKFKIKYQDKPKTQNWSI